MTTNNNRALHDFGGNGEVIILLHGFLASSKYWNNLQPLLTSQGYRVITIDLLGFGKADKPKRAHYDYDDHIEHLDSLIAGLHLNTPFTIIGHSMGALLAMRYALLNPSNVRSLVLLHPPLYRSAAEAHRALSDTNLIYRFLLNSRFNQLGWIVGKVVFARYVGRHNRASRDRSMNNIIKASEALENLAELTTKTLLLIGLKDRPEYTYNIKHSLPSRSVSVLYRNVTHHSPIRNTEMVKQMIISFIE